MKIILTANGNPKLEVGGNRISPATILEIPENFDPPNEEEVFYDTTFDVSYGTLAFNNYQINHTPMGGVLPSLKNERPSISELNGNVVTRLTDGTAKIRATVGKRFSDIYLSMRASSDKPRKTIKNYIEGSLSRLLSDNVVAMFSSGSDANYFSEINHTTGAYLKNINCWAGDLDISAVSVATLHMGAWTTERPGVLITAMHINVARHFQPAVGAKIRFCSSDGQVEEKIIVGQSEHVPALIDGRVMTLDSPVEHSNPMEVVGDWIMQDPETWIPATMGFGYYAFWYSAGLGIVINKARKLGLAQIGPANRKNQSRFDTIIYRGQIFPDVIQYLKAFSDVDTLSENPYTKDQPGLFSPMSPGDSGGPFLVVIDQKPVLGFSHEYNMAGPPMYRGSGGIITSQIESSDLDAIARGNLAEPTGLTVTVAPDPTALP